MSLTRLGPPCSLMAPNVTAPITVFLYQLRAQRCFLNYNARATMYRAINKNNVFVCAIPFVISKYLGAF